jgi:hypothetical protein
MQGYHQHSKRHWQDPCLHAAVDSCAVLFLFDAAADMWVAFAGPLTHIPMTAFWVGILIAATYIAYGTTAIRLAWPYALTYKNLGVAVCVGAVLVSANVSGTAAQQPTLPLLRGGLHDDS